MAQRKDQRRQQEIERRAVKAAAQRITEGVQETVVFELEGYRGPVPHPDLLKGFEEAVPNGAHRVLAMSEKEQTHRHQMDRAELRASVATHVLGQLLAFVLALLIIAAGAYLIHEDKDVAGYATLLTGAAGLIGTVVVNVRRGRSELPPDA
jgi:uncharacterized membrane protein